MFHCHRMWPCKVLSCLPFSFIASPGASLAFIACSAQFTSPLCCCATSLTGRYAPGDSSLASASSYTAGMTLLLPNWTNPTLDKSWRKIRFSASVVFRVSDFICNCWNLQWILSLGLSLPNSCFYFSWKSLSCWYFHFANQIIHVDAAMYFVAIY